MRRAAVMVAMFPKYQGEQKLVVKKRIVQARASVGDLVYAEGFRWFVRSGRH
jgi:hypothetical protein